MFAVAACITQEHDLRLVFVAALVCILSSFAAFAMLSRIEAADGWRKMIWIAVGALVTGNGFWATHYIAMLAYDVGMPTQFAMTQTVLSGLVIQLACLGIFTAVRLSRPLAWNCAVGVFLGCGIAAMHYIGMQGLKTNAVAVWDMGYVAASIVISIVFSVAAICAYQMFRSGVYRYAAPAILIVAICGLHFTGMTALTLIPMDMGDAITSISHTLLGAAIGVLALIVLVLIAVGVFLDRYLLEREKYAASLEAMVEKLKASEQKALEANKIKSEFVANISHEIRTPLNGILGMMRLLQDSTLNKEQERQVRTAIESAQGLLTVVNDILDFSKLEAGKIKLEDNVFSAHQVIDEVVSLMSARCTEKGLTVSVEIDPTVPDWLRADSSRLRQILFNLIGNAIKFTDKGSISLWATHEAITKEEIELTITVKDTGIGIPDAAQKKLFDRFSQADASTARKFGGTGLGLAISQHLARNMGGGITLKSKEGAGSAFTVKVRCHASDPPEIIHEERSHGVSEKPLRILVVDDNHVNQYFVSSLLTKFGHACELASNGFEALDAWRQRSFDVILMDIQMPELDGIEATKRIRKSGCARSSIPIIALTANAMAGDREKYVKVGMTDYVQKPIEPAELQAALSQITPISEPAQADDAGDYTTFDGEKLASLRALFGEKESVKMIAATLKEASLQLTKLQAAVEEGDLAEAKNIAHGLKGMASNWAAISIVEHAKTFEERANTLEEAKTLGVRLAESVNNTEWEARKILVPHFPETPAAEPRSAPQNGPVARAS